MSRVAFDVGCGRETRWMKSLKQAGYEPIGIDPCVGPKVISIDGFEVLPDWREYDYHKSNPHLISLNFVLEHVMNPVAVLRTCHSYLDVDGGQLLVEVPWDQNPTQMQAWKPGEQAWWVSTPDHVNYLNPGSLEVLLRRAGFQVEVMRSTYPIEQLLLQGHDYRTDPEAKKLAVAERAMRQRAHWALGHSALCWEGRTVWCVARKV